MADLTPVDQQGQVASNETYPPGRGKVSVVSNIDSSPSIHDSLPQRHAVALRDLYAERKLERRYAS